MASTGYFQKSAPYRSNLPLCISFFRIRFNFGHHISGAWFSRKFLGVARVQRVFIYDLV